LKQHVLGTIRVLRPPLPCSSNRGLVQGRFNAAGHLGENHQPVCVGEGTDRSTGSFETPKFGPTFPVGRVEQTFHPKLGWLRRSKMATESSQNKGEIAFLRNPIETSEVVLDQEI
jgi:hypothetical protein